MCPRPLSLEQVHVWQMVQGAIIYLLKETLLDTVQSAAVGQSASSRVTNTQTEWGFPDWCTGGRKRWLPASPPLMLHPLTAEESWRASVEFQIDSLISSTWPSYGLYVVHREPYYLLPALLWNVIFCAANSLSPLFSPAPRSPKTDLHHPPPPKAGHCPPWCLQRPPRPSRARRRLLLAPRPDPNEPRRPPGYSPRRSLRSP